MSARSFRSVFMVASCAGAALGCYLVSLRVASERAALEDVETKIVLAQRDLRLLQTEIGTRGRLAQLERWNVKVLALSAPSADQFVNGGFELAALVAPQRKVDLDAPVVLASASTDTPKLEVEGAHRPVEQETSQGATPQQMMHVASLKRPPSATDRSIVSLKPSKPLAKPSPEQAAAKGTEKPAVAGKTVAPTGKAASAKTKPAAAPAGREAALDRKPERTAAKGRSAEPKPEARDPLAPLSAPAKPKKVAATTSKDSAKKQ